LLGPVAGIMVSDYFFIRKTHLDINSLYHREGAYFYARGFNPRAIVALVAGVVVALIGLVVPALRFLYDYAWFVGFFVAAGVYMVLMRGKVSSTNREGRIERAMAATSGDAE
jgi:NCS1 family nucleobase:cation symporter-1